ncbi:MAG: hydroxymethylglutaryl-CoA lyase [Oscillospiraceae bacterium]|nr:hydroxymethylglutaryl-CoA lyase [Oscillospiraceae bacterium]
MAQKITVLECGPRDGWQNLQQILGTAQKLRYIDGLFACGVEAMEVTSFVSPRAIPQMADSSQVARYCVERYPDKRLFALIPNFRGAQNAYEAGIRNVTYVISLSESHNKANINRTHEQSFEELARILNAFPEFHICIGMATTFGCPFEGIPEISRVVDFVGRIEQAGVHELYLADTIGIADPRQVRETIAAVREACPGMGLQVHIHDTRGMGLVNTLAAIESGVEIVQSTLGGLGGCPFAPGASGNTATEDLVYMLHRMGYETGIDFDRLLALSKEQRQEVDGIYSGHHINIAAKSSCY